MRFRAPVANRSLYATIVGPRRLSEDFSGGHRSGMLLFAVVNETDRAGSFSLRHAHLIGNDEIVIPGEVTLDGGLVKCAKSRNESAALALQWDAGEPGVFTLRTCLLPERDEPYLLSLELARHRIMVFLVKLEDWGLVELPAEHEAMRTFEESRAIFTKALVKSRPIDGAYTAEDDQLARSALSTAIRASEMLAAEHARIEQARRRTHGIAMPIGCCIAPERCTESLRQLVEKDFDFIDMPLRWADVAPEEEKYTFAPSDKWIEWAVKRSKMRVYGGPLIDFRGNATPSWLHVWENDFDTLRDLVYEHVKRVITRYRRAIGRWTVTSGLNAPNPFIATLDQAVDLTRVCVLTARKLHPRARIQVEVTQPFGEYLAEHGDSPGPLMYLEMLFQAGVAIDAIGLRIEMGDAKPGRSARDLMQLADLVDRFGDFEKPINITAIGAPSEPPAEKTLGLHRELDPGRWRGGWSLQTQAEWLTKAIDVIAAHPVVTSICYRDLYDRPSGSDMLYGGLITDTGRRKPAMHAITDVRKRFQIKPQTEPAS